MNSTRHLASISTILLIAATCRAAVPTLMWHAETSTSLAKSWSMRQGATKTLEAHLLDFGEPLELTNGTPCALLWQTNGMAANEWWELPAAVTTNGVATAEFTADLPSGAKANCFFHVGLAGSLCYDALCTISVLPSPGYVVNALPLPASTIDFAVVSALNAPWTTPSDVTNLFSVIGGGVIEEEDPIATPIALAALAAATNSTVDLTPYLRRDTTQEVVNESWSLKLLGYGGNIYNYGELRAVGLDVSTTSSFASYRAGKILVAPNSWSAMRTITLPYATGTAALTSDIDTATNAVVTSIFSLTNALLVVSNNVATITTNGVPVWSSPGGSISPDVTNSLWQAITAQQATISALQSAVAGLSRDWGSYAPDGSTNPDPTYMLFINRPATVWAAGFQWATSGGHAVLTSTGTVAFAVGNSGELRIGPGDGTNYFGFVQGGSVEVGASATGFTVDTAVAQTATITYPYESGDFPALWFTADLSVPFEPITGVVWVNNGNGTATVTAPATTDTGFWRATTSATYAAEFKTTMPARLSGGVWGATNALPVVYDSTIVITSGGSTYRIPAEAL